jgi:hypothetical protein
MNAKFHLVLLFSCSAALGAEVVFPAKGLVLDLDAAKGLTLEDGDKVAAWRSQAGEEPMAEFVKRDEGRLEAGSGRPTLRKDIAGLNGKPALVFLQQELACLDEDRFDALSTGKGATWIAVVAAREQRVGLKDVNSFFGNLRNSGNYEGLWGCLDDDNTLWWGARNGLSFGRFDKNNPKLSGPKLETGKFQIVCGRMGAGEGVVKLELFVNTSTPVAKAEVQANAKADPSRLVIGQERDAIQHPGVESFDGEIARFMMWERPLGDDELEATIKLLDAIYLKKH